MNDFGGRTRPLLKKASPAWIERAVGVEAE